MKMKILAAGCTIIGVVAATTIISFAGQWQKDVGRWRYQKDNGGYASEEWHLDGSTWYHFNSRKEMQTGWIRVGDPWYYFRSDGAMHIGWLQLGNQWYYLRSDGVMHTGWLQLGDQWYYLKQDGAMQTGWLQLGDQWYFLGSSGAILTGWQELEGVRYYFKDNGSYSSIGPSVFATPKLPEVNIPKNMTRNEIEVMAEEFYHTYYDELQVILENTNKIRRRVGIEEVTMDKTLSLAAISRCIHMNSYNYFNHYYEEKSQMLAVGNQYGIGVHGEIIARGYTDPVQGWEGSPSHYNIIVGPSYKRVGIGYIPGQEAAELFSR